LKALDGTVCKNVATPEEALRKVGLKCEDIDTVIVGHIHPDHLGLSYKFPNAKFIVQKREIDFARNPHPSVAFSVRKKWIEGPNFEVIDGDKEIVPGVSVILTPGHTPGGQSVAVETKKGIAIITGFCVVRENFYPPKEFGFPAWIPCLHTNAFELYDSMIKVKEKADILLPVHEFDMPESIP
jgi:glyoxylase-like metal-dependent hydrolase (beta-lactamase superfamily II)